MALFAKNTKIQSNFMNKKKIINNRVNFYKIIYKSIYLFVKKIYYLILLKNIEEEILSLFDLNVSFSILLELKKIK